MLPLPGAITSQLDKASVVRLTISYLKLRDFSSHGDPPWNRDEPHPSNKPIKGGLHGISQGLMMHPFETQQGAHILQSLDGFTFALSVDGRFLYISETVSIYLGLSQVEMAGSSIFEYVHRHDHVELAHLLGIPTPMGDGVSVPSPDSVPEEDCDKSPSSNETTSDSCLNVQSVVSSIEREKYSATDSVRGYDKCFCIRMKSTLTKRGLHVKSSGYRVVHIQAHFRPQFSFNLQRKASPPLVGVVGLGLALPSTSVHELRLDPDAVVLKMQSSFRILYCDTSARMEAVLDWSSHDLATTSLYDHCFAEDLLLLRKAHVDLLSKGQVLTDYFRLLCGHGGFIWVQMCGNVLFNSKSPETLNQFVVVLTIISDIMFGATVVDCRQLGTSDRCQEQDFFRPDRCDTLKDTCGKNGKQANDQHSQSPAAPSNSESAFDENLNITSEPARCCEPNQVSRSGKEFPLATRQTSHLLNELEAPSIDERSPQAPVDLSMSSSTLVDNLSLGATDKSGQWTRSTVSSVNVTKPAQHKHTVVETVVDDCAAPTTLNYSVSNCLKQIYSSRESVIRTNAYVSPQQYCGLEVNLTTPTTAAASRSSSASPVGLFSALSSLPLAEKAVDDRTHSSLVSDQEHFVPVTMRSYRGLTRPALYPPPAHRNTLQFLSSDTCQRVQHYMAPSVSITAKQYTDPGRNESSWYHH